MTSPQDFVKEFAARGLIHDSTDRAALTARATQSSLGVYVGFDPTADSLHIGHLLGQITLRRLQLLGHRPFTLAGGATGMVGDPSGRSEERNLLDAETLQHNVQNIKKQLERILDFEKGPTQATLVDNADWTRKISMLDFLRDVGKHITVNQMLAKDSVKSRIADANGLSFTEFSYMLLQANDFRHLAEHHNCEMQMGGSDQWGNITAGIDLIRKRLSKSAFGLTWPLVTRADGTKFGKTADGAIWLDSSRTSPYQFRQYFIQIADADIEKMLMQFSLRPIEVVKEIIAEQLLRPETRIAQRSLARELTALVHGEAAAEAAEDAAAVLFGANPTSASLATLQLIASEVAVTQMGSAALGDAVGVLVQTNLASSNTEARRLLSQRSVRANGEQVDDQTNLAKIQLLHGRWLLLRKGKTSYHLVDIAG
ncbi:tyrosine--tRNA ligase [Acidimicrobiaceae bacterium]|nr:tyrosine--tRNA ligase [Acidimicrobiaceae bacterium]